MPVRVVIDTNVIISGMISRGGAPHDVIERWRRKEIEIITCDAQVVELTAVTLRPKFSSVLRSETRKAILRRLAFEAERLEPIGVPYVTRDRDDDIYLALARQASAEFVVSGDKDLLSIADSPLIRPVRIVSPAQFLWLLDNEH